jgi:ubiquinone/menaquinone biosynthesis C-methylase UbiE
LVKIEIVGILVSMNTWVRQNTRRIEKARMLLEPAITDLTGTWADLGCGDGVFSYLLFDLLQPESHVYAVDQHQSTLQRLQQNLRGHVPADKLHLIRANFTRPLSLPILQGIVLANVLHYVRHKAPVLIQLTDLLKPGGRVVVIEYNTSQDNSAVPYPMGEMTFLNLARDAGMLRPQIVSKAPSSFLGEMYTGIAFKPGGQRNDS